MSKPVYTTEDYLAAKIAGKLMVYVPSVGNFLNHTKHHLLSIKSNVGPGVEFREETFEEWLARMEQEE